VREIIKHLTPEERKAIEARIADVFAKGKRSRPTCLKNQGLLMASNILVLEVLDIRAKGRSERRIVRSYELDQEINLKVTFADAPVLSTTPHGGFAS
jgi:hypothetical protein